MIKYKVWITLEQITDYGTDDEDYHDVGLPIQAGDVFDTEEEAREMYYKLEGVAVAIGLKGGA